MLTPEQLQELPRRMEGIALALEESILEDIARRVAKTGIITDTAEYQIARMKEMGYANDFIIRQIAEYAKKTEAQTEWLFFETGQYSDEFYREVYRKAGAPFTPLEDNLFLQQLIAAGTEQTNGELFNFTRSLGFMTRDILGNTSFKPVAKAYQSALDLAHWQVSSGAFNYTAAIRNATKTLTDSGLRTVDYATGHINRVDVAVRRAVLTGVSQMTGKISEHNADELGTDTVEVTAHAGARPDHADWQGGWYSLSGKSDKYESLADATGYGTGEGLKGWNCRHDFYPVIPGVSSPAYTKEELENIDPPPIE